MFAFAMMAFAFSSCEDVPAPYDDPNNSGGTDVNSDSVYINETFATDFGKFAVTTVKGTPWVISHGCATATGYSNSVTTESESYLVSPAFDLTKSTGAYLQMDYILRYKRDGAFDKVLITSNYTGDPTTTSWTDITGTLTEGSDWTTFSSYKKNLPDAFVGQSKVVIAFYYSCTKANSSTWEIKNVLVHEGLIKEDSGETGGAQGTGTYQDPMNVTAALSASGNQFVKGYIVGYVYGQKIADGSVFNADTCSVQTNILIADNAKETNYAKCMPVQLPKGDVRSKLNLNQTKANLGKQVLLYGSVDTYFGVKGVKNVTYAELNGENIGTFPSTNPTGSAILSEKFDKSQGDFTIYDVSLGDLTYVWKWTSEQYGMKASAYLNKTNNAAESWLITPAMDFSSATAPTLSFDQALNYLTGTLSDFVKVMISTDYTSGDVSKANWTELTVTPTPPGSDWTFVTSTADLKAYAGKKNVHIALKYKSTTACAPTWEVKNFIVK